MTAPIVYWCAVTETCSVLIAAADLLPALAPRVPSAGGELLTFADTEALRALEAVSKRRPRMVALERQFAATPRGAALINRIKADPLLVQTEIRVLSHDSDYSRVLPRATPSGPASSPATAAPPDAPAPGPAGTERTQPGPATMTLEPRPLDQRGTRRAQRFPIAGKVDLLIDGNPAALVDLSTLGAAVVSPTILKPNQRVRVALADSAGTLRFNGSIAWASFEMAKGSGPRYRAGIAFVDADGKAVDEFRGRHQA
jgi:hypothetical protein